MRSGFLSTPKFTLKIALGAVLLVWAAADAVGQTQTTPWDMEQVMRALADIGIAESTFVERKESLYLTEPLVLTGTISFRSPDKLKKHVREPFEEIITIDGDTAIIEKAGDEQQRRYSLTAKPEVRTILESVRATLAGNLEGLESYYSANLWGEAEDWELHLIPRNEHILELIEAIRIRGAHGKIVRIETLETDGDRSVMDIEYLQVQ